VNGLVMESSAPRAGELDDRDPGRAVLLIACSVTPARVRANHERHRTKPPGHRSRREFL